MNSYLVERYLPGLSETELRTALRRVQAVCDELSAAGTPVRYLGSILLPVEEACFCRFDGGRPETIATVNERAQLAFARITAALAIAPGEDARTGGEHAG
jgi:Nickel responsive protein SCO4226-like